MEKSLAKRIKKSLKVNDSEGSTYKVLSNTVDRSIFASFKCIY
jgi:hypothetical protein